MWILLFLPLEREQIEEIELRDKLKDFLNTNNTIINWETMDNFK
jgi:hypothetical protein